MEPWPACPRARWWSTVTTRTASTRGSEASSRPIACSGSRCAGWAGLLCRPGDVKFRLLGPLRIEGADSPQGGARINAPKQRTVLAMLLARAGHIVPIRALVAEVWDDQPPRSAVANLRTYLMQLRKLMPPA